MYDMNQPGYANAGGWRYPGRRSSTEAFYQPRPYDLAQLMAVSGKPSQGLLDKAISDPALQAQGLLSGTPYDGGAEGIDGGGQPASDSDHMSLGLNGMGVDVGWNSDAATKGAAKGLMGGPLGLALGGLLGGLTVSPDPLGAFAQQAINAQEARDAAWAATPAQGSNETSPASTPAEAAVSHAVSPGVAIGVDLGLLGGGDGTAAADAAAAADASTDAAEADALGAAAEAEAWGGSDDGAGGYGGADNGYAMGGLVTPDRLHGMNPAGPDDGFAALDKGEYVITSEMVKKHGKKALKALNEGRASITMNKGK